MLYPGQEVLETKVTPYGKLTMTKLAEQYTLYENGNPVLLAGCGTQGGSSALCHAAPSALKCFNGFGRIGGAIDEVFKYSGVHVDFVETNPWLLPLVDKYIPFPRI